MIRKIVFPLGIVLILSSAYFLTLAPSLSWANGGADGGDFITAVYVNGVPHPTGYPLYLVIAKLFQWLPIGSFAYRTNIMSSVCTILASLLIYKTLVQLLPGQKYGKVASTIATLTFGLAPLVWSQAVITEVYGLQSLLIIIILYQSIFFGNSKREICLRGLLFGLALGNHLTTILLLPILFWEKKTSSFTPKARISVRLFGLLLGSMIYIILPLYARSNPVINWGNPVTLNSFIQLASGKIYQSYFSLSFVVEHVRAWIRILFEQFGIPGIAIGLFSIMDSKKGNGFTFPIAWIFISYGVFALFYASYDSYVYLIPTILAFSLWLGLGFNTLINLFMQHWHKAIWIIAPIAIGLFVWHTISVATAVDASKDNRAELFGKSVFDSVSNNAINFTKDDPSTFALWYFQFVEGKRADTSVIAEGLLEYDWYRQSLKTTYPDLDIPELLNLSSYHLILRNSNRPYCFVSYLGDPKIDCFHF